MKRVGYLWEKFLADENILKAIKEVNKTHRTSHGKRNLVVKRVEENLEDSVKTLKQIVNNNFIPAKAKERIIFDNSAQKERVIHEPPLWPDQYIHHMLIQVLEPIIMRGMDYWCCASIKGRGVKRGIKGIKKWMKDSVNTAYAAELDIHHFYESLQKDVVMNRMKTLIKDNKILNFISILISDGISIGAYFSQWFANTVLQVLDNFIRQKLKIKYYIRYMDNFTLFDKSKAYLHFCIKQIKIKLSFLNLKIKTNWQIFPTSKRLVCALGYRYGKNFSLLRKRSLFKLKKHLKIVYKKINNNKRIKTKVATGLISRFAQLKWCNSYQLTHKYIHDNIILKMRELIGSRRRRLNAGL